MHSKRLIGTQGLISESQLVHTGVSGKLRASRGAEVIRAVTEILSRDAAHGRMDAWTARGYEFRWSR